MPDAPTIAQKLAAELLGTFVLVFAGVGSVVVLDAAGGRLVDVTGIALAFGLSVMVMVYAVGRVSGGHFNPAVSLGAALGGRVSWGEAFAYMGVQVLGATVGAGALFGIAQGYAGWSPSGRMGTNSFGDPPTGSGIAWWSALLLELILTAIFVLVILAVTDTRNEHPALAPLAIGFTLVAIHLVAIPATGTSVNPARSIGPAIFGGTEALKQLWLFVVAPLLGGAVSGVVYPLVFGRGAEPVPGSGVRLGPREARAVAAARPGLPAQPGLPGGVPGYGAPDQLQQQWSQGGRDEWSQPAAPSSSSSSPSSSSSSSGWPAPAPAPQQPGPTDPEPDDGRTQIRPQR